MRFVPKEKRVPTAVRMKERQNRSKHTVSTSEGNLRNFYKVTQPSVNEVPVSNYAVKEMFWCPSATKLNLHQLNVFLVLTAITYRRIEGVGVLKGVKLSRLPEAQFDASSASNCCFWARICGHAQPHLRASSRCQSFDRSPREPKTHVTATNPGFFTLPKLRSKPTCAQPRGRSQRVYAHSRQYRVREHQTHTEVNT